MVKLSKVIVLFAASVVNAPEDLVSVPMAVLFIPVEVTLKLLDEIVKLFPPVSIEEVPKPERFKLPDVAVKLSGPVVRVSPF